uniref:Putative secreted protein n=1 Tax=Anopheles triannulatus TaxID=58253 RepID=A0A2M4B8G1_9DIPT
MRPSQCALLCVTVCVSISSWVGYTIETIETKLTTKNRTSRRRSAAHYHYGPFWARFGKRKRNENGWG